MVSPSKSKAGDDADFSELQFMTFTDIKQTSNPETKKKVRSHVQSRIQREVRNQRSKEKKGEIALNTSALSQAGGNSTQSSADSKSWSLVARPTMRLGAGRSDPFKSYPIAMDLRTHELFDHLHGRTCPMFKTLNTIGFFKMVTDDAAFRQILCSASAHMKVLRRGGDDDDAEAKALSSAAIKSVNRRIADPIFGISDGVLVTILAFACHAVMFNDFYGTLAHFNGLEEVIRRRGGLKALKLDPVKRTVLFWIDVHTAFLHDRTPRFPIPFHILPRFDTPPLIWTSYQPLLDACVTEDMTSAMNDLLALNQFITSELMVRDLWDDSVFAGLYVVPLLSKLLSARSDEREYDVSLQKQEICRIGILLYISAIRRGFGVKLSPAAYIPRLIEAIDSHGNLGLELNDPVIRWVIFIGGIQSLLHMEHDWFVSAVAEIIAEQKWSTWDELMTFVREVLWVEGILHDECHEFRMEVSAELRRSYGRHLS